MDLKDLRNDIDAIDDQLVKLFAQRMEISAQIAGYKKEKSLPIFVPAREREKLADVAEKAGPDMANYTRVLYSMLFELSRSYQSKLTGEVSPLYREIMEAIEIVPDEVQQTVLIEHYINGRTLYQIQSDIHYEKRNTIIIHGRALWNVWQWMKRKGLAD